MNLVFNFGLRFSVIFHKINLVTLGPGRPLIKSGYSIVELNHTKKPSITNFIPKSHPSNEHVK